MSTGEQDPLLLMVRGELASRQQMELLENLGQSMLDSTPGAVLRQCGYSREDTGASIRFTSWEPEAEGENPGLSIALYRQHDPDSSFMLTFMPGAKPSIETPTYEELEEAIDIADELLELGADRIDSRAGFTISHLKNMMEFFFGESGDADRQIITSGRDDTSMTEMLAWDLLNENGGGVVHVKEYGFRWDDGRQLEMSSNDLISDLPGNDVHDTDIPKFQITLDVEDFTYCYTVGQDGKRTLEVVGMNMEYALFEPPSDLDSMDQEVARFRKQIDIECSMPRKEDVEMLLRQLTEATIDDEEFYTPPEA